jgi:TfoX/Sxy family transcriptional regulator of competence genes
VAATPTVERWEALVATMLAEGAATYGNAGGAQRAFGSTSLKTDGKIFAMLVKDRLVVKLPAARVEELAGQGVGERFDPGHGRIQKEWLSVRGADPDQWRALATESEAFVAKRQRRS